MHPQTTVIIILSVVLGASLLSLSLTMVLVARFLWSHKDTATTKGTKQQQQNQQNQQNTMQLEKQIQDHQHSPLSTDRPWSRIFAPKRDRGHAVPTLSSIIKAGDETLYTSTLFHSLHGHPGPLPLESLLNAFAEELRRRPLKERSAYPADMSRFVSTARRVASTHKRTQSHITTHSTTSQDASQKPRGKSFDLDRELGRAMSISRKVTPVLVPVVQSAAGEGPQSGAWMKDMQRVEFVEGRPSLRVTSSELAALSVILGASVNTESGGSGDESSDDSSVTDKGAFGISIYASKAEDGSYNVHLKQHKLKISQLPSRGSGFSTLYAKHIASGSLPFAQDKKTVSSVLVTDETVGAIKSGTSLHLQKCTPHTQGSKFLATLPNTHTTVFHTLAPSTESTSIPLLLHTIADLPFNGGLVPLATTPIIQTIQFITSGGLPPARLLQRLDALVDKVHRHAPHLQLFGPLFDDKNAGRRLREHERLGKIATDPEALEKEPLAYKVARMQRYVTLIERLMVLVPDMKAAEVREKVREATRKEVERAYGEAISAYKDGNANTPLVSTLPARDVKSTKRDSTISFSVSVSRNSHSTRASSQRSSIASSSSTAPVQQPSATSTSASSRTVSSTSASGSISRHSSTFPAHNAGKLIENVLKENLPLDVKTIGLVARMVILAWTCSVGVVGEEGLQGIGMEMQTGSQEIRIW